jgi:hypothetical protein
LVTSREVYMNEHSTPIQPGRAEPPEPPRSLLFRRDPERHEQSATPAVPSNNSLDSTVCPERVDVVGRPSARTPGQRAFDHVHRPLDGVLRQPYTVAQARMKVRENRSPQDKALWEAMAQAVLKTD